MKNVKGFTLIELLIVVAIIGILAAIAIPNFLNAQVRAKVAKSKAEMSSLNTALEAYYVDHNEYPVPYKHPAAPANWRYNVPDELSTPIAYISSAASFFDPFSLSQTTDTSDPYYQFHRYGFINWKYSETTGLPVTINSSYKRVMGAWRLDGYGPSQKSSGWLYGPTYDPTNGTVSLGFSPQKPKTG